MTSRSIYRRAKAKAKRALGLERPVLAPPPYAPPRVEHFYWQSSRGVNFGDYLSSVVVQRMLARREFLIDEEVPRRRRLLAVGSVLHFANDHDTIWGSGVNGKVADDQHRFRSLDVRAVRGPLTRRYLTGRGIAVPEIYGDPALLLPTLMPTRFRRDAATAQGIGVVPNLHDLPLVAGEPGLISPLQGWSVVIDRILRSEFIISSSLHGIIIADAFRIPARLVRLSETEPMFKYEDYALGAGREGIVAARSIPEAMEMGPMDLIDHDPTALMAAFPYDLWSPAGHAAP